MQTMLDGPPKLISKWEPISKAPDLEPIDEVVCSGEREEEDNIPGPIAQEILCQKSLSQTIGLEGILEIDKQEAREMWEAVRQNTEDNWSEHNLSPFSVMDFFEKDKDNNI